MTNQELKNNIMRRVYVIFFLRKLTSLFAIKVSALALLFVSANFLVSVRDVLINMPDMQHLNAVYHFYLSAFLHTELPVQLLIVAVLTLFVFIVKDIIYGTRKPSLELSF